MVFICCKKQKQNAFDSTFFLVFDGIKKDIVRWSEVKLFSIKENFMAQVTTTDYLASALLTYMLFLYDINK